MIILVDTMFSSLVVSDCAGLDGLWKDVTPGKVKPFQFIWDSRKPFFNFGFYFRSLSWLFVCGTSLMSRM